MPLTVKMPTAEQLLSGAAAQFEYRDDAHAVTLRGTAGRSHRGLTITALEVVPDNGDVTGGVLRSLSPGELLLQLRSAIAPAIDAAATGADSEQCTCTHRRGGWPPITDELLRQVAVAYLEESAVGAGPGVLDRLASRFNRPEGTVRGWLKRARRDGWLGPVVQGRVGCEPGPRLMAAEKTEAVA